MNIKALSLTYHLVKKQVGRTPTKLFSNSFSKPDDKLKKLKLISNGMMKRKNSEIKAFSEKNISSFEVCQTLHNSQVNGNLNLVDRTTRFRINSHYWRIPIPQQPWYKTILTGLDFSMKIPFSKLDLSDDYRLKKEFSENALIDIPKLLLVNPSLLAALTGTQLDEESFYIYSDLIAWLYLVDDLIVDTDVLKDIHKEFSKKQQNEGLIDEIETLYNLLNPIYFKKQDEIGDKRNKLRNHIKDLKKSPDIYSKLQPAQQTIDQLICDIELINKFISDIMNGKPIDTAIIHNQNLVSIIELFNEMWVMLTRKAAVENWDLSKLEFEIKRYLHHGNKNELAKKSDLLNKIKDGDYLITSTYQSIEEYLVQRPIGGGIKVVLEFMLLPYSEDAKKKHFDSIDLTEKFIGISNDLISLEKEWDDLDLDNAGIIKYLHKKNMIESFTYDKTSKINKIIEKFHDHPDRFYSELQHLQDYASSRLFRDDSYGYDINIWAEIYADLVTMTNQYTESINKTYNKQNSSDSKFLDILIDWINGYLLFEKFSGRHNTNNQNKSLETDVNLWLNRLKCNHIFNKYYQRILQPIITDSLQKSPKLNLNFSYLKLPQSIDAINLILKSIPHPETVFSIDFSASNIKDIPDLSPFQNLKKLNLAATKISSLDNLDITKLQALDLSFCAELTQKDYDYLNATNKKTLIHLTPLKSMENAAILNKFYVKNIRYKLFLNEITEHAIAKDFLVASIITQNFLEFCEKNHIHLNTTTYSKLLFSYGFMQAISTQYLQDSNKIKILIDSTIKTFESCLDSIIHTDNHTLIAETCIKLMYFHTQQSNMMAVLKFFTIFANQMLQINQQTNWRSSNTYKLNLFNIYEQEVFDSNRAKQLIELALHYCDFFSIQARHNETADLFTKLYDMYIVELNQKEPLVLTQSDSFCDQILFDQTTLLKLFDSSGDQGAYKNDEFRNFFHSITATDIPPLKFTNDMITIDENDIQWDKLTIEPELFIIKNDHDMGKLDLSLNNAIKFLNFCEVNDLQLPHQIKGKLLFSIGASFIDKRQPVKSIEYLEQAYNELKFTNRYALLTAICYHIIRLQHNDINTIIMWNDLFQHFFDKLQTERPEQRGPFTSFHFFDTTKRELLGKVDAMIMLEDLEKIAIKNNLPEQANYYLTTLQKLSL